jgi:hypothetical protein
MAPVQLIARVVAAVFVVVGILGFVPGITTGWDELSFANDESGAELLGIFQVSVLHNVVHLLFGVGLLMASTVEGARLYLIGGGAAYLAVWVLGLAGGLEWLPVNSADNWLHLVLGAGMVVAGVVTGRMARPVPAHR